MRSHRPGAHTPTREQKLRQAGSSIRPARLGGPRRTCHVSSMHGGRSPRASRVANIDFGISRTRHPATHAYTQGTHTQNANPVQTNASIEISVARIAARTTSPPRRAHGAPATQNVQQEQARPGGRSFSSSVCSSMGIHWYTRTRSVSHNVTHTGVLHVPV